MAILSDMIDVDEGKLSKDAPQLLKLLLTNRTTRRNIVWGTSSYEYLGKGFESYSPITMSQLITKPNLIQPRSQKAQSEQKNRTKVSAEVFTPTWIVDKQVSIINDELKDLPLRDYVATKWLEITCGEAPYIVTRYDTVTGDFLPIKDRVGFLDYKLQRISREVKKESDWQAYVEQAYQSSYGYEYQGDSLLLARENLLMTYKDYYEATFAKAASLDNLKKIASIISYNIFQMDGLKASVPQGKSRTSQQLSLFEEITPIEETIDCLEATIKDWKTKKMLGFKRLASEDTGMKFDVVIGNPPYQQEIEGKNTQSRPIYNHFIETGKTLAEKSILITPARFLANTGATPKKWNRAMLNDKHFKINYFEMKSSKVFPNTDIKGGVAISYYDNSKEFEPIEIFIPYKNLETAYRKVNKVTINFLNEIMYGADSHKLSDIMFEENPELATRTDTSHRKAISSNIFDRYPEVFFSEKPAGGKYVSILGRENGERAFKYIKQSYIQDHPNLNFWKVLVPESNGSGAIGEVLSTPLVGEPLVGYSQTFISIGQFETKFEAESCFKYVKTKFARAMLGILKITQHNQPSTWAKVPLQDFTVNSDIDWTQSVADIDRQLYKKYGLNQEEIDFIEEKVREME